MDANNSVLETEEYEFDSAFLSEVDYLSALFENVKQEGMTLSSTEMSTH